MKHNESELEMDDFDDIIIVNSIWESRKKYLPL